MTVRKINAHPAAIGAAISLAFFVGLFIGLVTSTPPTAATAEIDSDDFEKCLQGWHQANQSVISLANALDMQSERLKQCAAGWSVVMPGTGGAGGIGTSTSVGTIQSCVDLQRDPDPTKHCRSGGP